MTDEIIAIAVGAPNLHIGMGENDRYPELLGGPREQWWPLLDHLHQLYGWTQLWHGGRTGADESCAVWAEARGLRVESFPDPGAEIFKKAKINKKDAIERRIQDMMLGLRGYEAFPADKHAAASLRTTDHIDGPASHIIALPGFKYTRKALRMAKEQGFMIHRVSAEPWVVNAWHYSKGPKGSKEFDLPRPFVWIQRGKSVLANPWSRDSCDDPLERFNAYLRELLQRKAPRDVPAGWKTPHYREVYDALDRISCDHVLVCTCVSDDGSVDPETGRGMCHGHTVVKAWRWWQRNRERLAPRHL